MEKSGYEGEVEEEGHNSEEGSKGENSVESYEDNLLLNQVLSLSTGEKVVVESKKTIPLSSDILPYAHCGEFTIS